MPASDTVSASVDNVATRLEIEYTFDMMLRYNYRLYPTPGQRVALARAFGCARVVFNDGLHARQEAFAAGRPYVTDAELSARLTTMKATSERAWLAGVSSVVLQQALIHPQRPLPGHAGRQAAAAQDRGPRRALVAADAV